MALAPHRSITPGSEVSAAYRRLSRTLTKLGILTRQFAMLATDDAASSRDIDQASRAMWSCGLDAESCVNQLGSDDPSEVDHALTQAVELGVEFMLLLAGILDANSGPETDLAAFAPVSHPIGVAHRPFVWLCGAPA